MWSFLIAIALFSTISKGQITTGMPPAETNKTAIFKDSFIKSTKYCSTLHETSMVQVLALFATRETDDTQGKCFLHCMLQRYRLMDKSGSFIQEKFKPFFDYIPASNFLKSIKSNLQACMQKSEGSSEACDKSYKFVRCFYEKGATQKKPGSGSENVLPAEGF